jgi:tetratricopeptide (TPR) repeat protein
LTAYDADVARIEQDIAELAAVASAGLGDHEHTRRLVYRRHQHASLTGNLAELCTVEKAIDEALARMGAWPDLCLLKAHLHFTLHRPAPARAALALAPGLAESAPGRALLADLDLQEDRFDEAKAAYEEVLRADRSWENLARLAYLTGRLGDVAGADRLYTEAEEELTAKEMRSFATLKLQRGLLHFTHGRYDAALAHYRQADAAYSGYWLVDEHIAELLGAQGKYADATTLYATTISRVPRPELAQALGDLYLFMGEPEQAQPWHAQALEAYLDSARRGEMHYYHHLADIYADLCPESGEAVRWAEADLALRPNAATHAALAWALYRAGRLDQALDPLRRALAAGVKDAQLCALAGTIFQSAGNLPESQHYLECASAINPRYQDFHVHH